MGKSYKERAAEAHNARRAITPVTPGEITPAESEADTKPVVIIAPGQNEPDAPATKPAESAPIEAKEDIRALPIDTTAKPYGVGSHMYPGRHEQLRLEAFQLGMKPWEIVETALAEYFERRYGKKSKRPKQ
jgi:hypothetical protein